MEFESDKDNSTIQVASENGHIIVVRHLLEWTGPKDERVYPTDNDNHAIRWASVNGHNDVLRLLWNDQRVISDTEILSNLIYSEEIRRKF